MSRRAAAFTQADVARAIRAVKQVDPGPVVVEITPGGIVRVRTADGGRPLACAEEGESSQRVDTQGEIVL
jgi:hypothetical protein